MAYREPDHELISRVKRCGLTMREIGAAINDNPSTVSGRLWGYSPLDYRQRQKIIQLCIERERQAVGVPA